MDLVDFTEPVLQEMRDPFIQRSAEGRFHVVLPSDTQGVSEGYRIRADLGRLPNNPDFGSRNMFFVQGAHHPRT